jgi:hypothetical protein
VGPDLSVKRLVTSGTGLTIAADGDNNVVFVNTASAFDVRLGPTGTSGTSIVGSGVGPDLSVKRLVTSGTGLTIAADGDNNVVFTNTSSAFDVRLQASGTTGQSIVATPDGDLGPNLSVKNLVSSGTGLTITADANNNLLFTNTSTAFDVRLGPTGTSGTSIVGSGVGPDLSVKRLVASGTGLTIAADGNNNVLFTNTASAFDVRLQGTGTLGTSLVALPGGGVGPILKIKNIVAGTNIGLSEANNNITITNTAPGAITTTLGSTGGGASLVSDPNGPTLQVRSLVGAQGIVVTENPLNITIATEFVFNQIFSNLPAQAYAGGNLKNNVYGDPGNISLAFSLFAVRNSSLPPTLPFYPITYTKIGPLVTLHLPAFTASSNPADFIYLGTCPDASFIPTYDQMQPIAGTLDANGLEETIYGIQILSASSLRPGAIVMFAANSQELNLPYGLYNDTNITYLAA